MTTITIEKASKRVKPAKAKKAALSNGVIDSKSADSFPMVKLIDQRIKESVPKEIIDRVMACTDKKQIICSTYPYPRVIKGTKAKEAMLFYTDTADAPWTVIRSDDKKRARLNAIRHVLHTLPYDGKDKHVAQPPDPLISASPSRSMRRTRSRTPEPPRQR